MDVVTIKEGQTNRCSTNSLLTCNIERTGHNSVLFVHLFILFRG